MKMGFDMSERASIVKKTDRIEWVDIAKGFAIILVCLGHQAPLPFPIRAWIFSFHIPLFFMLAGYTTCFENYASFQSYLLKKIRALLTPYFVFGSLLLVFDALVSLYYSQSDFVLSESLLNLLVGNDVGPIWFILPLFIVEVISYPMSRLPRGRLFIAFCLALLGYGLNLLFPEKAIFWNLHNALICSFFFWLVQALRRSRINDKLVKGNAVLFLVALAANVISLAANTTIDVYGRQYGNFWLFGLGAIGGGISVLCFCVWLERLAVVKKTLVYLGMNTIPIMAFHQHPGNRIVEEFFGRAFGLVYKNNVFSTNIEAFVYTACVILLCVPVIEFVNRFAPWMVGKRRAKRAVDAVPCHSGDDARGEEKTSKI